MFRPKRYQDPDESQVIAARSGLSVSIGPISAARDTGHMPRRLRKPSEVNEMAAAVGLQWMRYSFARVHKSRASPYPRTKAMAAGVADHGWSAEEIVGLPTQDSPAHPGGGVNCFELRTTPNKGISKCNTRTVIGR